MAPPQPLRSPPSALRLRLTPLLARPILVNRCGLPKRLWKLPYPTRLVHVMLRNPLQIWGIWFETCPLIRVIYKDEKYCTYGSTSHRSELRVYR